MHVHLHVLSHTVCTYSCVHLLSACVCMCVRAYMCMCTYVCIPMFIHECLHVCMTIHMCVVKCTYVCVYKYMCARSCACVYSARIYVCMCIYMYAFESMHMHKCIVMTVCMRMYVEQ